jgi:hypothetical protein
MTKIHMQDYVTVNKDKSMLFTAELFADAQTDGQGMYSTLSTDVLVTSVLMHVFSDGSCSDMQVQFSSDTWDVKESGLIYTDKTFLTCIKKMLTYYGFDADAVSKIQYSEQGMQGKYYVSFDADEFGEYVKSKIK